MLYEVITCIMAQAFNTIALIGKPQHAATNETLQALYDYLRGLGYPVLVESRVARQLTVDSACARDRNNFV